MSFEDASEMQKDDNLNVGLKCLETTPKIRLATCFSGIGAIEHALERLNLNTKIIFACDNGDVDILTKEVKLDFESIFLEFNELNFIIQKLENNEYKKILEKEVEKNYSLFNTQKQIINSIDFEISKDVLFIFNFVSDNEKITPKRKKEYQTFLSEFSNSVNFEF